MGRGRVARRADLARALAWGLGARPAREVAVEGVPAVPPGASEATARRALHRGTRMALLRDGRRIQGVLDADAARVWPPALSIADRLEHGTEAAAEARLWLLRVAGKVGEALGVPAFAVGGVVRDILMGRVSPDLDLAVEGDSLAFARALAEEVRGRVVSHPAFRTASIEGGRTPGGASLGRVDVAATRQERYDAPGALPVVSPTDIGRDLGRRDFSVNAMAVALAPTAFGRLLDPFDGRGDLAARRLRPLHPLSFVEDPTRVFRAARYAARLGFRLAPSAQRALSLARARIPYRALSGARLLAEIRLIIREPRGWRALDLLGRWGAFEFWDRGYRRRQGLGHRLRSAGRLEAWHRGRGLPLDPLEAALVALLADQPGPVWRRCLARLGIAGALRARLAGALAGGGDLARRVAREARAPRSVVARRLRAISQAGLVAAWLLGRPPARRRIEWFVGEGRGIRPVLDGDDLLAMGVPRGPRVGECLARLRDLRIDGAVRTVAAERAAVREWLEGERGGARWRPSSSS
jgi:tRNA nucleotidyltransferase (CCA-adding enzyme)